MKKLYISHSVQTWNQGLNGYNEARHCELIAGLLYNELKNVNGLELYICKPAMTLQQIVEDSNKVKPSLHLSIHTNAATNQNVEGTETLCIFGGDAEKAARLIHSEVMAVMNETDPDKKHPDRGVKHSPGLYELKTTTAPAVLIELGFHTNKDDIFQLITYTKQIAEALASGILNHMGLKKPHPVTPTKTSCKIKIGDKEFPGYLEGGYSYFDGCCVREVVEAFNRKVTWQSETVTVHIQ